MPTSVEAHKCGTSQNNSSDFVFLSRLLLSFQKYSKLPPAGATCAGHLSATPNYCFWLFPSRNRTITRCRYWCFAFYWPRVASIWQEFSQMWLFKTVNCAPNWSCCILIVSMNPGNNKGSRGFIAKCNFLLHDCAAAFRGYRCANTDSIPGMQLGSSWTESTVISFLTEPLHPEAYWAPVNANTNSVSCRVCCSNCVFQSIEQSQSLSLP